MRRNFPPKMKNFNLMSINKILPKRNKCKGLRPRNDHYQHLLKSICSSVRKDNPSAEKTAVRRERKQRSSPRMLRKAEDPY